MHFALVGHHPDGLAMARALMESGRHQLTVFTSELPRPFRDRYAGSARLVADLEAALADPAVECVLVAGTAANRAVQLRRAVQSERPVLCVHPADQTPDTAHEAAMIQADTRHLLLPLLSATFHPGLDRLRALLGGGQGGALRLVELEIRGPTAVLLETDTPGHKPAFPDWDVLQFLGGPIAEVSAFAEQEDVAADQPLLMAGRFEKGGLFQVSLVPGQPSACWRLTVTTATGRAELLFPLGRTGPAFLSWRDPSGERQEEAFGLHDPWPELVEVVEAAVRNPQPATRLTWQDEVRCLELDEAARRSVERRRTGLMEYQQANEEVGFKGTMTMVGCGVLWLILLLAILSVWFPAVGWAIGPILGVFLVLQLLLWVARRPKAGPE